MAPGLQINCGTSAGALQMIILPEEGEEKTGLCGALTVPVYQAFYVRYPSFLCIHSHGNDMYDGGVLLI